MNEFKIISEFKDINIDNWENYVKSHPNGNIFQTPNIFKAYQETKNYDPLVIVVLNKNNDIIGLQVSVTIQLYDNILGPLTSRSIIFGGPLIQNEDKSILDVILGEYLKKISGKAIFSQFRNMWNWNRLNNSFVNRKIIFEDHLDIIFDLTKGEEQLWKEMKRVRKKGINQSYKKGVFVKKIDLMNSHTFDQSYSILDLVYKRIKLPIPKRDFFENIIKNNKNNILSLGLYIEKELVAVRIALCYNSLVYDWYAGAKEEYLSYRPNDVLPWEVLKWGAENQYKNFDFGGAGKPNIPYGVRDYKLKFGGDVVNYGRYEIVHKPILMKVAKLGLIIKQKVIKK